MSDADAVIEAMIDALLQGSVFNVWGPHAGGPEVREALRDDMRAALRAAEACGWRLVPVEVTEEMMAAARNTPAVINWRVNVQNVYASLLAAAPSLTGGEDA